MPAHFTMTMPAVPRRIRPTIKAAVEWIALNDEPSDLDVESVASFISTQLAADLFGISQEAMARKVVNYRKRHGV